MLLDMIIYVIVDVFIQRCRWWHNLKYRVECHKRIQQIKRRNRISLASPHEVKGTLAQLAEINTRIEQENPELYPKALTNHT